jgi:hypothetical protein
MPTLHEDPLLTLPNDFDLLICAALRKAKDPAVPSFAGYIDGLIVTEQHWQALGVKLGTKH